MLDPPILPKGPGWTDGDMNNDLIPFFPLKLMNVTTVSIDSPISSKVDSKRLDPSFICIINKLNKSSIPIFRFFFKGDEIIEIKEYIAKINMIHATIVFIIVLIIIDVDNTDESLHKNNNKTSIDKINTGWINPMMADFENPIWVVLHNTNVLNP